MTFKEGSLLKTITDTMILPLHPAGKPFVIGGAAFMVIGFFIWEGLGILGLIFTLFCLFFFRDPNRVTPAGDNFIVSPADGRVLSVMPGVSLPKELGVSDESFTRISIFLSVLDVHVFRNAVSGRVIKTDYRPGKFVNAALDKASEDNERAAALIETADGKKVGLVQIAGLVARRIVTDLQEGLSVTGGTRYGIIRFGSRADIYIPAGVAPVVIEGQRAIGGETILADLSVQGPARMGILS